MNKTLLEKIRIGTITSQWKNNKIGKFEYSQEYLHYRFVETTTHPYSWIVKEQDRNNENTPIIIYGFIAFLIACWGQNEVAIYNTYNKRREKYFFDVEAKKPGSFKRDLDNEFAKQHLKTEEANIQEFNSTFDYISIEEKSLILEYARNYLEYTSFKYKQALGSKKQEQRSFKDLLISKDSDKLLILLHSLLDNSNTKGKDSAIAIIVLEQLGLLGKYGTKIGLFRTLQKEFGDIGTDSNFKIYLNANNRKMILDSEIESFITPIKKILEF